MALKVLVRSPPFWNVFSIALTTSSLVWYVFKLKTTRGSLAYWIKPTYAIKKNGVRLWCFTISYIESWWLLMRQAGVKSPQMHSSLSAHIQPININTFEKQRKLKCSCTLYHLLWATVCYCKWSEIVDIKCLLGYFWKGWWITIIQGALGKNQKTAIVLQADSTSVSFLLRKS